MFFYYAISACLLDILIWSLHHVVLGCWFQNCLSCWLELYRFWHKIGTEFPTVSEMVLVKIPLPVALCRFKDVFLTLMIIKWIYWKAIKSMSCSIKYSAEIYFFTQKQTSTSIRLISTQIWRFFKILCKW